MNDSSVSALSSAAAASGADSVVPPAALILFSHGSLLCGAGETLRHHAERIAAEQPEVYRAVEVGYLNYSEPPFEVAVERCRAAGARRIVVAPYFLVAGKFVKVDLPARIEENRRRFPELEFILADAVLDAPAMADAILEIAGGARSPERWRDDLNAAPNFCQARPACPLYETPACPKGPNAANAGSSEGVSGAAAAACTLAWGGGSSSVPVAVSCPGPGPGLGPEAGGGVDSGEGAAGAAAESTALLVMIHGSPRPESNDDVFTILDQVRARGVYGQVRAGFMECNEPDIPTAIDQCVAEGARRVVAVPYFLHTGNHVADDLPGLLEEACGRHPEVEFLMSTYVGTSPRVTAVLEERAEEAVAGERRGQG